VMIWLCLLIRSCVWQTNRRIDRRTNKITIAYAVLPASLGKNGTDSRNDIIIGCQRIDDLHLCTGIGLWHM